MYIDTTNDEAGRIVLNAAHADTAASAEKLTANAGSATNPVYFSGGIPVKTTYTLKKSVPSDAVFTDTTYDLATTDEDGLMSAEDKVKLNVTNIAYGICETGGGTLSKEVTLTNNSEWTLTPGSVIMVHFVNSNTVSNVTLNVNGTGDYPIWYNNAEYTSSGTAYCGYAGRTITYMFNGTHYVWLAGGYDTNSDIYLRVYRQKGSSYNKDYPLLASRTVAASLGTVGTEGSKEAIYGLISDNNANIPTTNPYSGMTKVKDLTVANDLTVTSDITVGTETAPGTITATGTVTAPTFVGNLTGNAATATNATAADKLNSNAGSSTLPVYFSGGVPVATGTSLAVSVTGSAAKWTTKRNFTIGDGTNTSTAVAVDGSGNVALKLPATIKATLTGNADTATNAAAADKLNSNAGDKDTPVYFSGGVPIACTSLDLNTTGSAAKWTTARAFKISDSDASNTSTGVNVDGSAAVTLKLPATIKATIVGNASTATNATAADKLNSNAGDKDTPVYFSGGVPVACTSLDLNTTGSAAKWTTARKITITDGTNTSTAVNLDGSTDVALNLPATIKAALVGNADTATNAAAADKLNSNAGSATLPVYFSGGVPVATGTSLAVNITKNAATATKWKTARNFYVADADATNTGVATSVDGSTNATLKLPATIKANLTGNADTATKAGALSVNGGSTSNPVYFSGGVPTPVTSIAGMTSVSAQGFMAENDDGDSIVISPNSDMGIVVTQGSTMFELTPADLSKLNQLANKTAGTTTKPIYFNNGVPTQCNDSLDVNISGTAAKASALNSNAGDANTPVYFDGGVPVKCTSLDLDTSGNAATATKLKTARTISISDADGTNTATGTSFDGNANITVKLPATIKASLTGKATSAGTADKLASNAGDSNTPVYFSGGIPTACTSLDLDTTGYAQKTYIVYSSTAAGTTAKVATPTGGTAAFPTTITEGTRVSVWFQYANTATSPTLKVGGANAIAISPTNITWDAGQTLDFVYDGETWTAIEAHDAAHATKADLATNATNAAAADKLNSNAGSATVPVYFDGGIPNACTSLSLDTTGNAATATKLATARTITLSGDVAGGAQFDGSGNITIETTVANDSHTHLYAGSTTAGGSANSAVKLDTATAGDSNTPVYFTGGKPVACTSLNLNTSGNAATATKLATARTIALTGSVTGSGTFDGSGNLSIATTTNHSHSYLPLSGGTMTGVITGKTQLASARLQGSASGYHQIFINSANAWMTAFTIRVYQAYKWSDIVISGYNYGSSYWYSPSAVLMGSSTDASITVTFGYTSASNLWVAIPASNYYGIEIIDCVNGYVAFDSWKDLFTISNVSTLSGTAQTTVTATRPWYRGEAVTGAVWNDYAECRESDCYEAGYVLSENGDDTLSKSIERLAPFAGVSSDTWGFSQGETEKAKTHIAVAGRVLVYPYQNRSNYKPGDCVCAAPGGTVDIMTREEVREWPDRIVGTVSCVPEYEEWGGGQGADRDPVQVNGRIWIKVK